MCDPDYVCVCKSTGTRAIDKLICKKYDKLSICFQNNAPCDGHIVLDTTLHYFILKN